MLFSSYTESFVQVSSVFCPQDYRKLIGKGFDNLHKNDKSKIYDFIYKGVNN
jgi:hypothetical protein